MESAMTNGRDGPKADGNVGGMLKASSAFPGGCQRADWKYEKKEKTEEFQGGSF